MQRKRTDATRDLILQALRAGNTRQASASYAQIHIDTFHDWLKRFPNFAEGVKKAEADAEVRHVANIAKASADGNWTASAWWLERRRHEDWGRKDRVEILATVRDMAKAAGLNDEETAAAVAEAERYLKEIKRGARA